MKKVIYFLVSLIFTINFFSCSSDTESEVVLNNDNVEKNNTTASERNANDLQQIYLSLQTQQAYLSFKNNVEVFSSKLPIGVAINFEDKEQLLAWIGNNLSETGFVSVQDASAEFDTTANSYKLFMENNQSFFNELEELSDTEIEDVFSVDGVNFNEDEYETQGGPCENGCINQGVECGREVDAAYEAGMARFIVQAANGNLLGAALTAARAAIMQHIGQSNCANDFNSCIAACRS